MKKAAIVSIGNEIMSGQIVDSNAAYLAGKLFAVGVPTVKVIQVGDDIDEIVRAFGEAAEAGEIVIVTGGLGPTQDDLTRQAMAKFLGVELVFRHELMGQVGAIFARRGIEMPEMNKIQAYIPAGCEAIENPVGTAPGIWWRAGERAMAVFPGVPSEMKTMFEGGVYGKIAAMAGGQKIVFRKLRCFGMGESHIAEKLGAMLERGRSPQVNITVQHGVISLHILASSDADARKDEQAIRAALGDMVFGVGEQSLAEVVGEMLAGAGKTLAVAESCTGGLVAKLITDVAGSSRYFTYGWVTYADEAKVSELGVRAETLAKFGAVSEQAAAEMAEGARRKSGADYAISVTGIAGPGGGSEQKPVGTVYIGIASEEVVGVEKFVFQHSRDFMRLRTAQTALNLLRLKMAKR